MYAEKNTPDNERKQFNFPAAPRAIIAPAVVECIVPALADLIFETADALAEQECGESTTVFDVERMAGDLLHSLADLLTLSPVPLRGVRDLLRFHQLDEVHAAAYFGIDVALPLELADEDTHDLLVEAAR